MKPLLSALLISALALSASSFADDYFPEIRNGKGQDFQDLPMGPVGGVLTVTIDTDQATIGSLAENGPGKKAGLQAGDRLTGIAGQPPKKYPKGAEHGGDGIPLQLGMAIIDAQASDTPLLLQVEREGKKLEVPIPLPAAPAFAASFPTGCQRSVKLVTTACSYLANNQKKDGTFGKKSIYSNSFAALALLSSGDKKYLPAVKRTVGSLVDTITEEGAHNSNWHTPAAGILLAEYILATGDQKPLPALQACCDAIGERLAPETGRLGHSGVKLPYGGKALVITSAHAHLMWALASHAGAEVDWEKWDLSYRSVKAAIGKNGNVGYNFSARGDYQSMARTAATATALHLAGREKDDLAAMFRWMDENYKRTTNCHAVASMAMVFGFMGMANDSPPAHRKNLDYHRWLLALATPYDPAHGAYYNGKRANLGGDKYLHLRTVGNYVTTLILTSGSDSSLWSFGNRTKAWHPGASQ